MTEFFEEKLVIDQKQDSRLQTPFQIEEETHLHLNSLLTKNLNKVLKEELVIQKKAVFVIERFWASVLAKKHKKQVKITLSKPDFEFEDNEQDQSLPSIRKTLDGNKVEIGTQTTETWQDIEAYKLNNSDLTSYLQKLDKDTDFLRAFQLFEYIRHTKNNN